MKRITITLPEEMKGYVEAQTSGGAYGNTSEYIRDLIRHDKERRAMQAMEAKVLEGLRSGPAKPWTKQDKNKIREAVKKQADKRRGS